VVNEETSGCKTDRALALGSRYAPRLLGVSLIGDDQALGDIIAVTVPTLCCSLYVEWLTGFVEQFARKRAFRALGLAALARVRRPTTELLLDLVSQLAAQNRLVLPRMAFVLVPDLAHVNRGWREYGKGRPE
jgi:hypothetical protein